MSQTDLPFRELLPFELYIPFIHILKKSFTIASGHDMSGVCNLRAILHIHDVLSELFYQYYGMCKENTVFQPYRIEMLKNHSGLQSGHAS